MYVNKSLTTAEEEYLPPNHPHLAIAQEVTYYIGIPICLLAILSNLLLIFVILKYNALKLRCNHYMLNFALCNILYLLSDYVIYFAVDIFAAGSLPVNWYCTVSQFPNYFLSMSLIFIAGYTFDNYILLSGGDYFLYMYKNGYKYIIGSTYPIHFMLAFIVSTACFHSIRAIRFDTGFIIVTIVYIILLTMALKITCDRKNSRNFNDKQLSMALKISLIALVLFLPLILFHNILKIAVNYVDENDLSTFRLVSFIFIYIGFSTSVVIAYMLFRLNKFFRLAFCKVFCKSRTDLDYSRLNIVPESDLK